MGFQKRKNAGWVMVSTGLGFLITGVILYFYSEAHSYQEKTGNIFLVYGALFIGIGITILASLENK